MIYIAICDDEEFMRDELTRKVHDFFAGKKADISILQFAGGSELLGYDKQLDIIFMDIQMQGMDGMQTAKKLRERDYKGFLIFVTVMKELVFRSFEVQAFDYLVKPIDEQCFLNMMQRLLSVIETGIHSRLFVQKGNECMIIPFDDIVCCEIINRKIYLRLVQQKAIDYYDKIENLEQKLDSRFFRCHRSYLINLRHLKSYNKGIAYLSNGEKIPVSRLRSEEFAHAILEYMKELRY